MQTMRFHDPTIDQGIHPLSHPTNTRRNRRRRVLRNHPIHKQLSVHLGAIQRMNVHQSTPLLPSDNVLLIPFTSMNRSVRPKMMSRNRTNRSHKQCLPHINAFIRTQNGPTTPHLRKYFDGKQSDLPHTQEFLVVRPPAGVGRYSVGPGPAARFR